MTTKRAILQLTGRELQMVIAALLKSENVGRHHEAQSIYKSLLSRTIDIRGNGEYVEIET